MKRTGCEKILKTSWKCSSIQQSLGRKTILSKGTILLPFHIGFQNSRSAKHFLVPPHEKNLQHSPFSNHIRKIHENEERQKSNESVTPAEKTEELKGIMEEISETMKQEQVTQR
jgi:hypothetical protein